MDHSGAIYACTYSKELNSILTGGADKIVASWKTNDIEPAPFSIKTNSAVLHLNCFEEHILIVGLFNGHFHLIDLREKKELKYNIKHSKGLYSSAYDARNGNFATGDGNGTVCIWGNHAEELLVEQKLSDGKIRTITCIEGRFYIGDSEGFLYVIDGTNTELLAKKKISDSGINAFCELKEKSALVIGNKNAELIIVSTEDFSELLRFPAHNWPIYKIVDAGNKLITCSRDKTIKSWSKSTFDIINRYSYPEFKGHTHSINNMIYLSEERSLISVGDDKAICLWKEE